MATHHLSNFVSVCCDHEQLRFGINYSLFHLQYLLLDNIDLGSIERFLLIELFKKLLQHFWVNGHDLS
jgi:hypothetical protein